MDLRIVALFLMAGILSSLGQLAPASAAPPTAISADLFKGPTLPFGFKYGGKDSKDFLGTWQNTDSTGAATDGHIRTYVYTDPATHLKVTCAVRTFDKYDAVDWVLTFTNEGTADTPILENVEPLQWTMGCDSPGATVHAAKGSNASLDDFMPRDVDLPQGGNIQMGSGSGRSSEGDWIPFFNLQTGDHGLVGAIGWTGSWQAHLVRNPTDGKTIDLTSGLPSTHLILHPGESIRTPRILLMNWKGGDVAAAQNLWRQFMIDEYSPKDAAGKNPVMPISWDTWGTEFASVKLKVIQGMAEQKIPADLYWIDAGWYEPIALPPGGPYNTGSDWATDRGDWILSKNLYPDSMKPLGEALKAAGIDFLVWFEAETSNPNSKNLAAHPDWYYLTPGEQMTGGAVANLKLGDPEALKWITDLVSDFITDNELTWYRQDYNFSPQPYWDAADAKDGGAANNRVGINQTASILGLYKYWDDLRARHPGLRIDNCASGGRRLDIETMSRSVSLWRSDNAGDPIGEQFHTLCYNAWVPMNAGVWWTVKGQSSPIGSAKQLYDQRSGYSSGMTVCIDQDPAPWIKAAFEEYEEVRPYYMGDFYPLTAPSADPSVWAAWQCQKLDKGSGVAVVLRRPGSSYATLQLDLKSLDPNAQYSVEIRVTRDKAQPTTMKGSDLQHLAVTITDKPGSALVFYTKQ
jgi:alpha-galactosidase